MCDLALSKHISNKDNSVCDQSNYASYLFALSGLALSFTLNPSRFRYAVLVVKTLKTVRDFLIKVFFNTNFIYLQPFFILLFLSPTFVYRKFR